MPIKLFWMMSNNVQRIQARNDLRALNVSSVSAMLGGMNGSVKGLQDLSERLADERGDVIKVKFDPIASAQLDRKGLEKLRKLSSSNSK